MYKLTSFVIKNKMKVFGFLTIVWLFFTFIFINTIIVSAPTLNIGFLTNLEEKLYKHDKTSSDLVFIDNIPYIDYNYKENIYVGLQINPLSLTRFAEDKLDYFLNNNSDLGSLNSSLFLANWLINNKIIMNGPEWENGSVIEYYMWAYNFTYPYGQIIFEKPFYSALAQGHIIYFFEKMYITTNNFTFHEVALKGLNALNVNIKNSGLLIIEEENHFWLPELADLTNPTNDIFILGGFMHTIQNLYLINEITNSSIMNGIINKLIENSITNLIKKIPLYNHKGIWSFYDRLRSPTAPHYHILNTDLVSWLYGRTNSSILFDIWSSWKSTPYQSFPKDANWYLKHYLKLTNRWLCLSVNLFYYSLIILGPLWFFTWKKIMGKLKKYSNNISC